MRLFLFSLVTSCWLLPSCASLPSHEQLETWKANTDKALATAADWADKAKKAADAVEVKYAQLSEAQAANVAKLEAIAGPIDANGDGKVTADEMTAFAKKLAGSEEGRGALLDWQTYAALIGAWAGWKGVKKGTAMVAKVTYAAGKDLNGDGVIDEEEAKAS